jgi:hypothetical protein
MRMLMTLGFADAGLKTGTHRVFSLQRNSGLTKPGDIGPSLAEGRQLLECVQHEFVAAQAEEIVTRARTCPRCGRRLPIKDGERRRVHTLFGHFALSATRWVSCGCDGSCRRAFSPLRESLSRSSNELRCQAARWGSAYSYRAAAAILHDLLGVDWRFGHVRIREAVLEAGARLERENGTAHDSPVPPVWVDRHPSYDGIRWRIREASPQGPPTQFQDPHRRYPEA